MRPESHDLLPSFKRTALNDLDWQSIGLLSATKSAYDLVDVHLANDGEMRLAVELLLLG